MKRGIGIGVAVVAVGSVVAGGYAFLTPRIGHASAAEIEAVIPNALLKKDVEDAAAQSRYGKIVALCVGLNKKPLMMPSAHSGPEVGKSTSENEAILAKISSVLQGGPIESPPRQPNNVFQDASSLKDAAKLIALATSQATADGDRVAAGKWADLGLQFSDAVNRAGGVIIDQLVACAIDSIAVRAAYLAEIQGGLDDSARRKLLGILRVGDGSSSNMANAVRRDYRIFLFPTLLSPQDHLKEFVPSDFGADPEEDVPEDKTQSLAGTYDPVETAKLTGRIYSALISNLERPWTKRDKSVERELKVITANLPDPSAVSGKGQGLSRMWSKFQYRLAMNSGKNTLGRQQAASDVFSQLGEVCSRQAANRNLLRAILQLRHGMKVNVADPFSTGHLKFDLARKIVWSVGKDGIDQKGSIGRGFSPLALDLGYPYGDNSWQPAKTVLPGGPGAPGLPPGVKSFGPPGSPIPGAPAGFPGQ